MKDTTISVDVAKSVFDVAVSLHPGHVSETHRLPRPRFARFFASLAPTTVVMEARGMAHHWRRELQSQGHRVVLLPPPSATKRFHPIPVKTVSQALAGGGNRTRVRLRGNRDGIVPQW